MLHKNDPKLLFQIIISLVSVLLCSDKVYDWSQLDLVWTFGQHLSFSLLPKMKRNHKSKFITTMNLCNSTILPEEKCYLGHWAFVKWDRVETLENCCLCIRRILLHFTFQSGSLFVNSYLLEWHAQSTFRLSLFNIYNWCRLLLKTAHRLSWSLGVHKLMAGLCSIIFFVNIIPSTCMV